MENIGGDDVNQGLCNVEEGEYGEEPDHDHLGHLVEEGKHKVTRDKPIFGSFFFKKRYAWDLRVQSRPLDVVRTTPIDLIVVSS